MTTYQEELVGTARWYDESELAGLKKHKGEISDPNTACWV